MYKPAFNKVLVEIDDAEAAWGGGNDESMLGKSYNKGRFIDYGMLKSTNNYPLNTELKEDTYIQEYLNIIQNKAIMWHEGAEAGTVHEVDGKQYGLIYWWDIVGAQE